MILWNLSMRYGRIPEKSYVCYPSHQAQVDLNHEYCLWMCVINILWKYERWSHCYVACVPHRACPITCKHQNSCFASEIIHRTTRRFMWFSHIQVQKLVSYLFEHRTDRWKKNDLLSYIRHALKGVHILDLIMYEIMFLSRYMIIDEKM